MSRIIKLNIGGTIFETSSSTLLSCPDSFFGSLLSGRLSTTYDDNGAYFVDRSGEFFSPILHYLRTRQIVVPPAVSHDAVLQEAKFYSLDKMVEELNELSKKEEPQPQNVLRMNGCYVNYEDQKAYVFLDESRLLVVQSSDDDVSASLQAKVAYAIRDIPASWSDDAKCKEDFASFFTNHVQRGYYSQEGVALKIIQPGSSGAASSAIGLVSDKGSQLLVCSGTGDCFFTSFEYRLFS
ncbi:uncharacterized protein LOC134194062 [Corticium candelabrum]|uniref:uncharacterized protein LOC134194062 n=1 Tax=Corticium candelabrum TaxID=121492 RepID=UPI002E25C46C|nr:uncharacterized protein LOC134194062 [Corticium candelabrum]